jgi:dTDP-4-dehydrorhamnose 3,5-epimerase
MTLDGEPQLIPYLQHSDDRGGFSTPFSPETLSLLNIDEAYISVSQSRFKHTVRGMHYQLAPFSEAKLLSVIRGSIFDILIDLGNLENGKAKIHTFELSAERPEALFIPRGFAHGYQTLSQDTQILYALDSKYDSQSCAGYSPLSNGIKELWPSRPSIIKEEDLKWPMLP